MVRLFVICSVFIILSILILEHKHLELYLLLSNKIQKDLWSM